MKPILLVEDTEDDIFFLERGLKKAAVERNLVVAKDGKNALDYIFGEGGYGDRHSHPLPCMVLLDLKLPKFSGLEVLGKVREKNALPDIPIIVLTSSSEESDIRQAYALGANSYKVKPSNIQELTEFLKDLSNYWFVHDQGCAALRPA